MTTKNSPVSALKAQASAIAAMLKAAERGEKFRARERPRWLVGADGCYVDDDIFVLCKA